MEYMFNNCTRLKSLNFDFKMSDLFGTCMNVISQKFMFNNCISLTYMPISSLCFYCAECPSYELNNIFYNCFSLKSVIFNENYPFVGHNTTMSYMFYNCTSLVSLSLFFEYTDIPYDMSYAFTNCSSLKNIELDFFSSDGTQGKTMSNAFRDCTVLVSIHINFVLDYEDMSYAFMDCHFLQDLDIYYFNALNVKYMNHLFYNCWSLSSIDFLPSPFIAYGLIDISYMFRRSYLTKVNFTIPMSDKINNYQGLFYDCYDLEIIDVSSFTHNNLPDTNLSIFNPDETDYCFDKNVTIFINEEFLKRIETPNCSNIVIKNKTYFNNESI